MNKLIFPILFVLFSFGIGPSKVIKKINGHWVGQLTYRDYSSEKMISIPVSIIITQENDTTWVFKYNYPKEPHANTVDTVMLSNAGKYWNNLPVTSLKRQNKMSTLTTEGTRDDDGIQKQFRYTYSFDKNSMKIQKEEMDKVRGKYFIRNSYQLKKVQDTRSRVQESIK